MSQFTDGWTIEECIGRGAFGEVYRISREEFGHTYQAALKVMHIPKDQAELDAVLNEGDSPEEAEEYFYSVVTSIVEEFVLMSKMKGHSNIVSYEDHSVEKKEEGIGWTIYIRMELLTPLYEHIRSHNLSRRDVVRLGIDLCKALQVCARYHVIHRDIKPENIFVNDMGIYKLGDFGIARELEKTSAGLSKKGTKSYMAPEVYHGRDYNETVDIYSVGLVLYRFLNDNRLPFLPNAPEKVTYSDREMAFARRFSGEELPEPVHADGMMAEVIHKACAYEPEMRYQTAAQMRADLERVLDQMDAESGDTMISVDSLHSGETVASGEAMPGNDSQWLESEETVLLDGLPQEESEETVLLDSLSQEDRQVVGQETVLSQDNHSIVRKKSRAGWLAVAVICVLLLAGGGYLLAQGKQPALKKAEVTSDSVREEQSTVPVEQSPAPVETEYSEDPAVSPSQEPVREEDNLQKVPFLVGKSRAVAVRILKKEKLTYKIRQEYSTKARGKVIRQSIRSGKRVKAGSEVTIVISKGKKKVRVVSTPKPKVKRTAAPRVTKKPATKRTPKPTPKADGSFGGGHDSADGSFE